MNDKTYPPLPNAYDVHYDETDNEDVRCYSEQQMRTYVDADRAQRVALEDEAIEQATGAKRGTPTFLVALAFCRAIEAAHGIHKPKESGDA